ncbi:MAG: delta-60 repeat domain-containing protein [Candidatus Dependentiae bacterium]|nr:delta-60 repeat domain-containing protein [Candidatus Dependentiae bacterium]
MQMECTWLTKAILVSCLIPFTAIGETLDITFNPSGTPPGTVTTPIDSISVANGVAVQPDGKIVIAGFAVNMGGDSLFALARYNTNGTLDTSFGVAGIARTSFGVGSNSSISAVVLQPDGKIVAAGTANVSGTTYFGLARYNSNGTLDTSFNPSGTIPGTVTIFIADVSEGQAVALQADGKIVVAGFTITIPAVVSYGALARYNSDGTLDASFGIGGKITMLIDTGTRFFDVALQTDGKIVAAGFSVLAGVTYIALTRYNANGTLDTTSFGTGTGIVTTLIGTRAAASGIALQADGKIVVSGNATVTGIIQSALARYNSDGTLDTNFNPSGTPLGTVTTPVGTTSQATKIALQTDGKIVAAGQATITGITQFLLARYTSDGTLDATFSPSGMPAGIITTIFDTSTNGKAQSLAIQVDGKIVVAGQTLIEGAYRFAIARYGILSSLIESALTVAIQQKYCLFM